MRHLLQPRVLNLAIIAIQTTARNGKVVSASLVREEDDVMLITNGGVLIRTRASEISELSRATQGVTLISLDDGEKLIGLSRVPEADGEDDPVEGEVSLEAAPASDGEVPGGSGDDAGEQGPAED